MTGRPIYVEPHGDRLHVHAILEAKLICRERKYQEIDASALQRKGMYPGIPDICVRIPIRRTNDHGVASHDVIFGIIEIETDATAAAIRKKRMQFDTSLAGHELYVIDLKKCKDANDIGALSAFLKEMLP